ncbi:MAG TPA: OmpA family protein [Polyangiaceae bacterium]|jgi:chemotaxis protein MotB
MKPTACLAVAAASLLAAACVPQGKYDAAAKDAADAKAALAAAQQKADADAAARAKLEADLAACSGKPLPPDHSAELTAQLEALRRQKAAADARAALFNEFVAKFRKMIDAGKVSIHVRRGRIVLSLHNDVLFDEGKTDLKPAGKQALTEIGQALRTVAGRSFQVAGHTDNLPIKSKEFPSNWELSTERAVVVVKFLAAQGVNSGVLSAAGYGEFDPVAPNTDAASRSKNRRIEISLVPNIEELISLPELKGEGKD